MIKMHFIFKSVFLTFLVSVTTVTCIGEIALAKCEEYAKAVYSTEDSPVLLPRVFSNQVSQCGIVEVPLIIGGTKVAPKEFPHMAAVGFGKSPAGEISWMCGGSLISELFVLSAAHCLKSPFSGDAQKVRLGVIDLNYDESAMQEKTIVARIAHPEYKPPSKYNDIALFKLDSPVTFTPDVRPACIHVGAISGNKAIATGFGKLAFDADKGNSQLMKVQITLLGNSTCGNGFRSEIGTRILADGITDNILCAGEMSGGKDTCQGDSGGPLQIVLDKPYCMYSIVGVTSFGKFCGFQNTPAIYTRTSSFVSWIEKTVW